MSPAVIKSANRLDWSRLSKSDIDSYTLLTNDILSLKSQVVSLQTAHSWANAGVLLGDACIGSGVAFEAIKLLG